MMAYVADFDLPAFHVETEVNASTVSVTCVPLEQQRPAERGSEPPRFAQLAVIHDALAPGHDLAPPTGRRRDNAAPFRRRFVESGQFVDDGLDKTGRQLFEVTHLIKAAQQELAETPGPA